MISMIIIENVIKVNDWRFNYVDIHYDHIEKTAEITVDRRFDKVGFKISGGNVIFSEGLTLTAYHRHTY